MRVGSRTIGHIEVPRRRHRARGDDAGGVDASGAAEGINADPDALAAAEQTARDQFAGLLGAGGVDSLLAVRRPGGAPVVGMHRLIRAGLQLAEQDASTADRIELTLSGANPPLAAYLTLLLGAGRSPATLDRLADAVAPHRRDFRWLHHHLAVLDGDTGPAVFIDDDGAKLRLRQNSPAHSGAAAVILMRVLLDPAFALWLTTGFRMHDDREPDGLPFGERFRAQQDAVAAAVNRRVVGVAPWPRFLGSSPPALARFINRFTRLTGGHFEWVSWADLPSERRDATLDEAATAANLGLPVPLVLGGATDRQVLLVMCGPGIDALRCFDPAAGMVIDLVTESLLAGHAAGPGLERVEGVVLPSLLLT